MKLISHLKVLAALSIGAALFPLAFAHADGGHDQPAAKKTVSGEVVRADDASVSPDWLAKAKAQYPLDSCVVSEDKFDGGDMGTPQDYVYRQTGKPDRLVRFCCKDCIGDFNKDPAKFLETIDAAAEAKAKSGPSA